MGHSEIQDSAGTVREAMVGTAAARAESQHGRTGRKRGLSR